MSPCLISGALLVLGVPVSKGLFAMIGFAALTAWSVGAWVWGANSAPKEAQASRGLRCLHCGYPIELDGPSRLCPECGKLPHNLEDKGAPMVDMACHGCGRHIVDLPSGDSCQFCGHGLTYAQAAELVGRRKEIQKRSAGRLDPG